MIRLLVYLLHRSQRARPAWHCLSVNTPPADRLAEIPRVGEVGINHACGRLRFVRPSARLALRLIDAAIIVDRLPLPCAVGRNYRPCLSDQVEHCVQQGAIERSTLGGFAVLGEFCCYGRCLPATQTFYVGDHETLDAVK